MASQVNDDFLSFSSREEQPHINSSKGVVIKPHSLPATEDVKVPENQSHKSALRMSIESSVDNQSTGDQLLKVEDVVQAPDHLAAS